MKKDGNVLDGIYFYLESPRPNSASELFQQELLDFAEVSHVVQWLDPMLRDFPKIRYFDLVNEFDHSSSHKFINFDLQHRSWFWGLRLLALTVALRDDYSLDDLDFVCCLDFERMVNSKEFYKFDRTLRLLTIRVFNWLLLKWRSDANEGLLCMYKTKLVGRLEGVLKSI